MIVVDGRFPGQAAGMTIGELIYLVRQLGLYSALNLDGGGSSTLWCEEAGVVNRPSDNRRFDHEGERRVTNCIAVVAGVTPPFPIRKPRRSVASAFRRIAEMPPPSHLRKGGNSVFSRGAECAVISVSVLLDAGCVPASSPRFFKFCEKLLLIFSHYRFFFTNFASGKKGLAASAEPSSWESPGKSRIELDKEVLITNTIMDKMDLKKYGITGVTEIVYNPSYDELFREETKKGLRGFDKGVVTDMGAVNVMTGVYTGRSPKDKFFVMDETTKDTISCTLHNHNHKPLTRLHGRS